MVAKLIVNSTAMGSEGTKVVSSLQPPHIGTATVALIAATTYAIPERQATTLPGEQLTRFVSHVTCCSHIARRAAEAAGTTRTLTSEEAVQPNGSEASHSGSAQIHVRCCCASNASQHMGGGR